MALAALAVTGLSLTPEPAKAAVHHQIDIPASRLGEALVALGRQARISIGATGDDVAGIQVRGLRGGFTSEQALARLLNGTGFTFVRIDSSTFRIIRAASSPEPSRPVAPAPAERLPANYPPIIVTGSKRGLALNRYAATVDVVNLHDTVQPITGASGSANLLASLPMLASTQLGRGRNKLFIRGVADSSFTGPTQATVGQYFGEVRLNYNAPDPDLSLYDIDRVEVIEGPQGTLYGAGTLGGVLRLIPNSPQLDRTAMSSAAGVSETRHGAPSYDLAAMINVPMAGNTIGLRIVGYQSMDGGYINDAQRRKVDINRMHVHGARATIRVDPGDGWTVDLGGLFQSISTRDSQYSDLDEPPLTRRSAVEQPFDNDYQLWHGTVRKAWGNLELVSATGFVQHDVSARYDATPAGASEPVVFDEEDSVRLLTHETRIARRGPGESGWVAGLAFVKDVDRVRRRMGMPDDGSLIAGVRNSTLEASLFGEVSVPITASLTGTVGGRLAHSHLSGQPLINLEQSEFEPDRDGFWVLPTAALAWRPRRDFLIFARYQEGFRAGGLSIGDSLSDPTAKRFESDRIRTIEAGVRLGQSDDDRFTGSATLSYARWQDIQADLIEPSSLPTTANIGNGRIYGFEISARWKASRHLTAHMGIFLNDSTLSSPAAEFEHSDVEDLPNIARAGVTAVAAWHTSLTPSLDFAVQASGRYVGKSQLGVGPALDLSQGDYFDGSFDARFTMKRLQFTIGLTNLTDVRANRFALGNPFGPTAGRQATPLRPRTLRLGVEAEF